MRRLSSQIFVAQLVILTTTMLVGFVLFVRQERGPPGPPVRGPRGLDRRDHGRRPGRSAAACSSRLRVARRDIQRIATTIEKETGASYVVVIDMNRVRHSHPNPALIGQQVAEPIVVADGRVHVGTDNGSTGRSANGKAPLLRPRRHPRR